MFYLLKRPPLIVFDPLAAYLGDGGEFGCEIQARINPLVDLAERGKFAILAITHRDLRVPTHGRRRASYLATARTAFYIAPDERDDQLRRLFSIKNNLSDPATDLSFRIDGEKLIWQPTTTNQPPTKTERQLAADWLLDILKDGPRPANEIYAQARCALFSGITLRRAARDAGIRARPNGFRAPWVWEAEKVFTKTENA